MNCQEAQALMSAYHDGELSAQQTTAVRTHVSTCTECARELAAFRELSSFAASAGDPVAPAESWESFSRKLAQPTPDLTRPRRPQTRRRVLAACAAALLVAVFGGIGFYWWHARTEHGSVAKVFDVYLAKFSQDSGQAQRVLISTYGGQPVTIDQATDALGYRPVAAVEVPPGYQLENIYLLQMPCCKCPQALYRRNDGHMVAVFEHENDRSAWFGDRPTITCRCNGEATDFVQIEHQQLAASWQHNTRRVTIIGAEDIEEVARIMAGLKRSSSS